jgi:hypothetical protein
MEARLDGADRAVEASANRLEGQVGPEMQDQHDALVVAERPDRTKQLIVSVDPAEWVIDDDGPGDGIKGQEADLAATAEPISTYVDEDPVKPSIEARGIPQRRRRPPRSDQSILRRVLGLRLIAQNQAREPECPVQTAVGEVEHAPRCDVSGLFRSCRIDAGGRTVVCCPDHIHKTRLGVQTVLGRRKDGRNRIGRRVRARDPIAGGRPKSRRSTPERLHEARREATRQRLISEGELPDQAERLIAHWELEATQDGIDRDGRYWEDIPRGLRIAPEAFFVLRVLVSRGRLELPTN